MNNVEYLIVSSTLDYSTDLICLELHKRGLRYLRINRDRFSTYQIGYSYSDSTLKIKVEDRNYNISELSLKAIYFRAPCFIRSHKNYTIEEQLERSQWNAFIRNLIVLENVKWINNPVNTYKAENKMYQLKIAKKVGLCIPETFVGNYRPNLSPKDKYIVKALDTPLFYSDGNESFTYTTVISDKELERAELQQAPVIIQEYILDKLDIRATVVGQNIFPVGIYSKGVPISGDWRTTKKENLDYVPLELPEELNRNLLALMKHLGLEFGGVDLIKSNNKYYFIEVNPTGEWGWLVKNTGIMIDRMIVDEMAARKD